MSQHYSTEQDLKERYGGILESPYISKAHRHLLDGFKVTGLRNILKDFHFKNILDVGCGFGEYTTLDKGKFTGVDNSFPRVKFARRRYQDARFIQADATRLPFKDKSFDAVLLANTIHHLNDEAVKIGLEEMKRVSRQYLIIDDCVKWTDQTRVSQFFYSLDRGTMFRTPDEIENIFKEISGLKLILKNNHRTFPGLYVHAVFVLQVEN